MSDPSQLSSGITDLTAADDTVGVRIENSAFVFQLWHQGNLTLIGNATGTVPKHSQVPFPVGAVLDFAAGNATPCSVAAYDGNVTIHAAGNLTLAAQYSGATLYQTTQDTWLLIGGLG